MLSLWVLSVLQGCASGAEVAEVKKEDDLNTKFEDLNKRVSELEKNKDGQHSEAYGMEDGPWQIRILTKNSSGAWTVGGGDPFGGIVVDDDPWGDTTSSGIDNNWYEFFATNLPMMNSNRGWAITVGGTGPNCANGLKCLKLKVRADWGIGNGHVINKNITSYEPKQQGISYHSMGVYGIYYSLDDANSSRDPKGLIQIYHSSNGFVDEFYGNDLDFPKENTLSWYVIPVDLYPTGKPKYSDVVNIQID